MLNIEHNNRSQFMLQLKTAQQFLQEKKKQDNLKQRIYLVSNKIAYSKQHINEY